MSNFALHSNLKKMVISPGGLNAYSYSFLVLCRIPKYWTRTAKTDNNYVRHLRFIYKSKQNYNMYTNTQDIGNYGAIKKTLPNNEKTAAL